MFTLDDIKRLLQPIKARLYGIVGRALLTAIDNSGKTQKLQFTLFEDEVYGGIDRMQEYGLETYPDLSDPNNEVAFNSVAGNKTMAVVVCVHNRNLRPKDLAAGDVCLYAKAGQRVWLKNDKSILIQYANGQSVSLDVSGSITVNAGNNPVNINGGNIKLKGTSVDLKDSGGKPVMLETIIAKLNLHVHGGVTAGADTTGTMSAGGTILVSGTDSAPNVKAAI